MKFIQKSKQWATAAKSVTSHSIRLVERDTWYHDMSFDNFSLSFQFSILCKDRVFSDQDNVDGIEVYDRSILRLEKENQIKHGVICNKWPLSVVLVWCMIFTRVLNLFISRVNTGLNYAQNPHNILKKPISQPWDISLRGKNKPFC